MKLAVLLTLLAAMLAFVILPLHKAGWLTNFEQAKKEAQASHKQILLNFSGSDWCGPCMKLRHEVLDSETFMNYASDKLVLVNADFPRLKKNKLSKDQTKQNEVLADMYNKTGVFPLTLLLDENGKVLKKWEGNPDLTPEQFVGQLQPFHAVKM